MAETQHSKTDLRAMLRQRRAALSLSRQRTAAKALEDCVTRIPTWTEARHIAIYIANDGEIDAVPLGSRAHSLGKQVYLPVIAGGTSLEFARWDPDAELVGNRFGIPEPPPTSARRPLAELDIVFVPVVGWDLFCNRLGMGSGYYDRALSGSSSPLRVGLAHEIQRVDRIPHEPWDVVMDYIATDAALYRRRGEGETAEMLLGDNNSRL